MESQQEEIFLFCSVILILYPIQHFIKPFFVKTEIITGIVHPILEVEGNYDIIG